MRLWQGLPVGWVAAVALLVFVIGYVVSFGPVLAMSQKKGWPSGKVVDVVYCPMLACMFNEGGMAIPGSWLMRYAAWWGYDPPRYGA